MLKVKMLTRYGGPDGKLEQGLEYLLPASQAVELVNCGLARFVVRPACPPVHLAQQPTKAQVSAVALKELQAQNPAPPRRPKKKL